MHLYNLHASFLILILPISNCIYYEQPNLNKRPEVGKNATTVGQKANNLNPGEGHCFCLGTYVIYVCYCFSQTLPTCLCVVNPLFLFALEGIYWVH